MVNTRDLEGLNETQRLFDKVPPLLQNCSGPSDFFFRSQLEQNIRAANVGQNLGVRGDGLTTTTQVSGRTDFIF